LSRLQQTPRTSLRPSACQAGRCVVVHLRNHRRTSAASQHAVFSGSWGIRGARNFPCKPAKSSAIIPPATNAACGDCSLESSLNHQGVGDSGPFFGDAGKAPGLPPGVGAWFRVRDSVQRQNPRRSADSLKIFIQIIFMWNCYAFRVPPNRICWRGARFDFSQPGARERLRPELKNRRF